MYHPHRILIVDDNHAIHDDIRKALNLGRSGPDPKLVELEEALFDESFTNVEPGSKYRTDSAFQGLEGLDMIKRAKKEGDPFSLVFLDVRMPPGLDGVRTAQHILQFTDDIEVVLCSAFGDYSWEQIIQNVGDTDRLLFLRKPFDIMVVKQMVHALTMKCSLRRESKNYTRELVKARDLAQDASREKTSFLSNISHEIRTPLNGVIGMSQLMARTRLDSQQREYLSALRKSADLLFDLIRDVLDFSKIEAGKLTLDQETFDLEEVFTQIYDSFNFRFTGDSLFLKMDLDHFLPKYVVGDALRLKQILTNLLSNALKFTERGGVNVRLRQLGREKGKVRLRCDVRDTGIGINPEHLERLFRVFSQVDTDPNRKYQGTGLGLVICKRLVQLMDGAIGVESFQGIGSSFWFEVVLGIGRGVQTEKPRATAAFTQEERRDLKRILVAEDNEVNQKVIAHMLQRGGFPCDVVATGEEALNAVQSSPYDLVLMDCHMPVMDGFDSTREIRNLSDQRRSIPIVAITASAIKGEREKCLGAGMNDFLAKPVIFDELIDLVTRWLNHQWRDDP